MIERNEAYKRIFNPKDLCIKPFCTNYKVQDHLGLCNQCLNDLVSLIGLQQIYDYSDKKSQAKITIKEAVELLIEHKKGNFSNRFRLIDEPCSRCQDR